MKLRKINAVFSILTTIMLLDHTVFMAVWMLSEGSIPTSSFMPRLLTVFFLIHAIISIILMISLHKESPKNKGKHYPKMNIATIIQRISGALMIILTPLHILGALGVMQPPPAVHAVVPPLFFLIVMGHVAVSASKALITLGIGNAKFVKAVDIVIKIICAAALIAAISGFYLYKV